MKKAFSLILIFVLAVGLCIPASAIVDIPALAAEVQMGTQKLCVNGRNVTCEAFELNERVYYRLRDLAYLLSGSASQFDIGWDAKSATVSILTRCEYTTATGIELSVGPERTVTAQLTQQQIVVNGVLQNGLTVYNVDGTNYIDLVELSEMLRFDIFYILDADTYVIWTTDHSLEERKANYADYLKSNINLVALVLTWPDIPGGAEHLIG